MQIILLKAVLPEKEAEILAPTAVVVPAGKKVMQLTELVTS